MNTARNRLLVRNSWESMRPTASHVADLFHDRLFELDPSLEELFPEDLQVQRLRFVKAVSAVVGELEDLAAMLPLLHDVGRRLANQGLREGQYVTMGKALLWTFEQTLADQFAAPQKEAWASLYAFVSSAMIAGTESRELHKPRERTQLAV
jgi:hemoglobin-like flavoprotein